MDDALRELSRIIKAANREFPSMDWNVEKQCAIDKVDESDLSAMLLSTTFYFMDRLGTDQIYGDTSLHRLLAMHAPAVAVRNFLDFLEHHHAFLGRNTETGRRSLQSSTIISRTMMTRIEFQEMPPPPFLHQQNYNGVTALHVAIFRNPWHAGPIVRMLLEAAGTRRRKLCGDGYHQQHLASIPMIGGSFPLHILCGHNTTIQKEVLSLLLEADAKVALKDDRHGDNPFSLLWKNVLRFRWAISMEQGQNNIDNDDADDGISWMTVISPEEFLLYSLMMIKALRPHRRNFEKCLGFSLHEICSIPRCPPLLLRLALSSRHRSKFGILGKAHSSDENGMLPIHHALQCPRVTNRFVPPYFDEHDGPSSVVEILLEEFPESVFVKDNFGRIPLHYALSFCHLNERALLTMIQLYPESLRLQDPVSGLYPFMLVSIDHDSSHDETLKKNDPIIKPCHEDIHHLNEASFGVNVHIDGQLDQVQLCYLMLQICPEVVKFHGKSQS